MTFSFRKAPVLKGKNAENFITKEKESIERLGMRTNEIIKSQKEYQ